MLRRTVTALSLLFLASASVVACGDVDSSEDFATDSWKSPTHHGELSFRYENRAEFSESNRFHAWTFELSGDAAVVLETDLKTANLDTIAYLYRRDSDDQTWGSYIAKNDDGDDSLASKLEEQLGAGQYLLKIKTAKTGFRGSFAVLGSWYGAGCPTETACVADETFAWPAETNASPSCMQSFQTVLTAPITRTFKTQSGINNKCDAGAIPAKAIDLYVAYWDGLIGWSDFVYDDEEENPMYVGITEHGDAGQVIDIDVGADEDGLSFVFDAQGELVAFHHSEQSPTSGFFCGDQPDSYWADPECVSAALRHLPHEPGDVSTDQGTITGATAGNLDNMFATAVTHFQQGAGIADDASIAYQFESWGDAGRIQLDAGGDSVSYMMLDDYDIYLLSADAGAGPEYSCEMLSND
jgi:hypothetical protein